MRRIEITKAFKRDLKRAQANPKHRNLHYLLAAVLDMLGQDVFATSKFP